MLDPHEKAAFDGLVADLYIDDARFMRRLGRLQQPRRRLSTAFAIALWAIAPICVIFGGWTGVIFGLVAALYGAFLYVRRPPVVTPAPWSSHRRPEASF